MRVLGSDPDIEIVGCASDGATAYALCRALRPSVVTLDMEMPGSSGLEATERIMADCPTPILIVSASRNRRDAFNTFDALAAGAMDVLDKPRGDDTDAAWAQKLIATVKVMARVKPISHPRRRLPPLRAARSERRSQPRIAPVSTAGPAFRLVAIGASTGGPSAVARILGELPPGFPLPILVVIHIGSHFGAPLADWLDTLSPFAVRQAVDGEPLPEIDDARVLLAAPDRHLMVEGERIRLIDGPERNFSRPSVEVLFESVARSFGPRAIGCLLTGMGSDGATGLLELRRAGALTIAQDETSSVVYGMPRAAALLGAAAEVLPLSEISGRILAATNRLTEGAP